MKRRGFVLIQVMIVAVILGLITAMVLRSRLQAAQETSGAVGRTSQDLLAQSAINQVSAAWAQAGNSCASNAASGVFCSGGGCNCTCTVSGGATVTAASFGGGGGCQLTVAP